MFILTFKINSSETSLEYINALYIKKKSKRNLYIFNCLNEY